MPDFGAFFTTKQWQVSGSHGERLDGEVWYRTDLKEMFIQIDGEQISMMEKSGAVTKPQGEDKSSRAEKLAYIKDMISKKDSDPKEAIGLICDILEG